ncbi:MAG: pyruvate, phosphate dikinase [Planctomycetia bacterium]|nr:MAG: pyruvate, phosphate dikinase [Planctomycetia bacterium]
MTKFVYFFGAGKAEGDGADKQLLGGKGAGLAEMTRIGLPVPAGFTIAVPACAYYHSNKQKWPGGMADEVRKHLVRLEKVCGKKLGDPSDPLLVSVRSGAARSMPGMMETILNLGLNDRSVEGLARVTGNRRFAYDAYRRFITMYGATAMGVAREKFDSAFEDVKVRRTAPRIGAALDSSRSVHENARRVADTDVNEAELVDLVATMKDIYRREVGSAFPQAPWDQLYGAINAVFHSWNAEKAATYRRVEKITDLTGTAVNICQMVFGNMGDDSGTGVCFTRNPSTGENRFYGDLLINAQGEDVVAGIRTPLHLEQLSHLMPDVYDQLLAVRAMLEIHYGDMQDLEFTVERGKLYMLQCRAGKRTPGAAFRIAVEQATQPLLSRAEAARLVKRGHLPKKFADAAVRPVISREQAVMRIAAVDIERLFYPVISGTIGAETLRKALLARGIDAVPGAACGRVVFSAAAAEEHAARGEAVILVRKETSPEDVGGMQAARGILTQTGGKTSHAAVVARGWGKCCIVGCEALHIDYSHWQMTVGDEVIRQGDFITLNGSDGSVYRGELPLEKPTLPPAFNTLMKWADDARRMKVRTNADTPEDARKAIEMGAEGIGLCRTEHMFFATRERQLAIQEMIVADTLEARVAALDKLLPYQREDFIGIFKAMNGLPVTIRLIDPPLHEFVPKSTEQAQALSRVTGLSVEKILQRADQLHESNPMLGHRGCRLCITYPEILDMQVRAIIEAAIACVRKGVKVLPEIMIPLTIDARELAILDGRTRTVADQLISAAKVKLPYLVGTMIETPRAALLANRVAEVAEFFSFGTNDLTQMTMGLSRDDAGRFLPDYVDRAKAGIFADDPFQSLDQEGVGMLVRHAIEKGRGSRDKLKIGICGEHGGEADSVKFCHTVGMDYVSCSPYRVPIARLAAAQAAILDVRIPVKKEPRVRRAGASRAATAVRGSTAGRNGRSTKKRRGS